VGNCTRRRSTGSLPDALTRYVGYQLQFEVDPKKIHFGCDLSGFTDWGRHPCNAFSVGYVVPKFSVVYENAGRDIPWLSQVLLSRWPSHNSNWIVFACALLTVVILRRLRCH